VSPVALVVPMVPEIPLTLCHPEVLAIQMGLEVLGSQTDLVVQVENR